MDLISKEDKVEVSRNSEQGNTPLQRLTLDRLPRVEHNGDTLESNESDTIQAASAVSPATVFSPSSIVRVPSTVESEEGVISLQRLNLNTHTRVEQNDDTLTSNESDTIQAASAESPATVFPPSSIVRVPATEASEEENIPLQRLSLDESPRVEHNDDSLSSNESDTIQAASPAPVFQPSSIVRVPATEASRASTSHVAQPSSRAMIRKIPSHYEFDPLTFDPTHKTLPEVIRVFRRVQPVVHFTAMTDILLKYSLSLHGLPPCPKDDLMSAIHFFLEWHFEIKIKLIACCYYEEYFRRSEAVVRVGVLFDTIQTPEFILERAHLTKRSGIEIKPNKYYQWIMVATAKLQV